MVTTDDFWRYLHEVFVEELLAGPYYNGDQPLGLRGFLNDKSNRMIGYAIARQTRVERFTCGMIPPMDGHIKECSGTRGLTIEDSRNFCLGWTSQESFPGSCEVEEFVYRNSTILDTLPYVGRLGNYGAGGYVMRLKGGPDALINKFTRLQSQHWIDKGTRVVFIEWSVYNANVNLFTLCTIVIEFIEGGGTVTKWGFQPVKLLTVGSQLSDQIVNICRILFVVATVVFTVRELFNMKKEKFGYFSSYWNITEILLLIASYVAMGLYFYKSYLTEVAVTVFNKTRGNAYVRMDPAINVDMYYVYLLGFILFFSTIKLIKLLQFNKRMNVLAMTISRCWGELSYFFIAFAVIFFAFCALFYFMFRTRIPEFSRIIGSIVMCFSMMLGKFDFQEMKEANTLSPILFFVFSVLNSMILINIMLTIILQAFNEIKLEIEKKSNKYDVLDFMWASFKKFARMQPNSVNQVNPKPENKKAKTGWEDLENEPENLPDKVCGSSHIKFIF